MVRGKSGKNGALKVTEESVLRNTAPSAVSKAEGQVKMRSVEFLCF